MSLHRIFRRLALIALALADTAHAVEPDDKFLIRPPGPQPVVVHATFELRDINEINEQDETVEFTGTFTLEWQDSRQIFDPSITGISEKLYHGDFQFNEVSPAWYPQVYLANESGTFESHDLVLRIRPDGTNTLIMPLNATAEIDLNMRRFPFDSQDLKLRFALLGFNASEVVLKAAPCETPDTTVSQWNIRGVSTSADLHPTAAGNVSEMVASIKVDRQSIFTLRLVALPLMLIVALSWTVFWMERSSLGDRLNVSFVGILTAVAYQLVVSDLLPHVAYFTLMHAFLNISFFIMCAGAVMNLIAASHERSGRYERGHLIDHRCRWAFPIAYIVLLFSAAAIMFALPPVK